MTVETTIHLTQEHLDFLQSQVRSGAFVSLDAAVAAALDLMIADEDARNAALCASAGDIRERLDTPPARYLDRDPTFAAAWCRVDTGGASD